MNENELSIAKYRKNNFFLNSSNVIISPRTLKILVEILFHSANRFATWKRFCPPKSLTMLNGNAANNSLMNKGTLELLNRDRKNSRISTNPFAHPSVFSVSRTCRDFFSPPSNDTKRFILENFLTPPPAPPPLLALPPSPSSYIFIRLRAVY